MQGERVGEEGPLFLAPVDTYAAAVLGVVQRPGDVTPIVVYDKEKLLEIFESEGMDEVEADEWLSFNLVGAWVGPGTPAVLERATMEELEEIYGA